MSRACRCDRCGEFYSNRNVVVGEITINSNPPIRRNVIFEINGTNQCPDLCQECKNSFIEWWHKPQTNKETDNVQET